MTDKHIPATPTRKDYTENATYKAQAEANATDIFSIKDPFALVSSWMAEAREKEINDSNAMSLATVDGDGLPDVRIVLLKSFDTNGFVFFSNAKSNKGQQLNANSTAALCLHWKSLRRQVRVRGSVLSVTQKESNDYFASRAREAQIGAWASQQSSELGTRMQFETEIKEIANKYDGKSVPRPPHWQGWRVTPSAIEFWRDRPFRLHDRLVFTRDVTKDNWTKHRLYP